MTACGFFRRLLRPTASPSRCQGISKDQAGSQIT